MHRLTLLAGSILLSAAFASAQVPSTYRMPLSVVDEHGNAIEDLSPSDIQLQAGDAKATVTAVHRYYKAPVRMVIVLDDSGSMGLQHRWEAAVFILRELLRSLPPGSSVGLLGVEDGKYEVIRHPEAILNYANNVSRNGGPHGQTPLLDAIERALQELPQPRPSDLIFVLSDGGDNRSKIHVNELRDKLRAAGVRVSGAILSDESDHWSAESAAFGPSGLLDLFKTFSGWNATSEPFQSKPIRLNKDNPQLRTFLENLYDFYVVEFTLDRPVSKSPKLKLRVRGVQPKRAGKINVAAYERLPEHAPGVAPAAARP